MNDWDKSFVGDFFISMKKKKNEERNNVERAWYWSYRMYRWNIRLLSITKLGSQHKPIIQLFKNKGLWTCGSKRQSYSALSFAEKGKGERGKENTGKEKGRAEERERKK